MDEHPEQTATPKPHWLETLILVGGEFIFAVIALPLYIFLVLPKYPDAALPGFVPVISATADPSLAILATAGVIVICIGLVAAGSAAFGASKFKIDAIDDLLENFSTLDLVLIYIAAGFAEEFLFRVVLIDLTGVVIAALLFTAAHAAYWRKPLMLAYTFCIAIVLSLLYLYTGSLLLCAVAHAVYNLVVSLLMKKGILPLGQGR